MAEVYLDSERVDFQGAEPTESEALWGLLDGHLRQQGRAMGSLILDGVEWKLGAETMGFEKAAAESVTLGAHLEALLEAVLSDGGAVSERIACFSRKCLSQNAATTRAEAISLVEALQPFMQVLEQALAYGTEASRPWVSEMGERRECLNTAMSVWLDALEAGSSVPLSDCSALSLEPAFRASCVFARDSVLGEVEAMTS